MSQSVLDISNMQKFPVCLLTPGMVFWRRWLIMLVSLCFLGGVPAVQAEDEAAEEAPAATSSYVDLQPPFVTNYGGAGRLRFLRADVSLRVEAGGEPAVMHHMPAIRHKLIMLLSRQTEDAVSTMEGKELMRLEALEEVRNILMAEEGEHNIRDLLFTRFVIQR
jgi:flagellar FliL protein